MAKAIDSRVLRAVLAVFVALLAAAAAGTTAARAAAPPALWKKGENCPTLVECGFKAFVVPPGLKQVETTRPHGITADPETGHLYVADQFNRRIVELTAWGEFVKARGWGVLDGSPEAQSCSAESACLRTLGSLGFGAERSLGAGGAGEFNAPVGVAVDSGGDVYVVDAGENHRVQKFDREGEFLRSWGGGVVSGGAAGSGDLSAGSVEVVNLTTTAKAFEIGQTVSGAGIAAGTTIRDLGIGTITLSAPATASGTGVAIVAAEGAGNVPTNERKTIALEGSPSGGTFTLTFAAGELAGTLQSGSDQLTDTKLGTEPTIGSFHVGDTVLSQVGALPPGTTITAIDTATGSLTLSAAANADAVFNRAAATETTAPLPFDAGAAEVEAALAALAAIGAGNVTVSGPAGGPWSVEFGGPLLGDVDLEPRGGVARMSGDGAALTPAGAKVSVATARQGASAPEICAVAAQCRAGLEGDEPGAFGNWPFSSFIAIGPGDTVYVGDEERIQTFDAAGAYLGDFPDPGGLLVGKRVRSLALDAAGDAYLAVEGGKTIRKLDPAGELLCTASFEPEEAVYALGGIAPIPGGGFYAVNDPSPASGQPELRPRIVEFDSGCGRVGTRFGNQSEGVEGDPGFGALIDSTGLVVGDACYTEGEYGLYVTNLTQNDSFVRAYGPTPDPELCAPPELPPSITAQYAVSVGSEEARLGAKINPHFWGDATYRLEYGTAPCSEGGCTVLPEAPGRDLGGAVEAPLVTLPITLAGLAPDTTYHYRFVAESGGGGPVQGRGGTPGEAGAEATFTTHPIATSQPACANDVLRGGAGAALPDCRGYEMVSPVDKAGGDIVTRLEVGNTAPIHTARLDQSALSGDRITYSSYRAFADPVAAPYTSQYIASRGPAGWSTEAISAATEGGELMSLVQLETLYRLFSPELERAWNFTNSEPVLGPGGVAGYPNIYRRENGTGSYEACTSAEPPTALEPDGREPELQGASADHSVGVLRANWKLTAEAAPGTGSQLYVCAFSGGGEGAELRPVSVLPDGSASELNNQTGSRAIDATGDKGHASQLAGAVSADGERVFWSAASATFGPGRIYLRVNATRAPTGSGECEEAEAQAACTIAVSGAATAGAARFWGASGDGGTALFEALEGAEAGNFYLFDTAKALAGEAATTLIGEGSLGVAGHDEELERVYFASEEALGGEGEAGEVNLYLYEGGETRLVARLAKSDLAKYSPGEKSRRWPSPVNERPDQHRARVSADGGALVFMSRSAALAEEVAGYDNSERESGEPAAEVYRYSLAEDALACISCDRSGARPLGRILPGEENYWAAAEIPGWESSLHPLRPLSSNGKRVFFTAYGPLVSADTNGRADLYEWEEAGEGGCEEGSSAYVPASGGCQYLISSGRSPADTEFIDASPEGDDVFFATEESLVDADPGSIDLYDARVGGGTAVPAAPPAPCEGQACQSPAGAPRDPTPASQTFSGAGNLKQKKAKKNKNKRCRKGTHRVRRGGKVRCVKNRRKHHRSQRHDRRGPGKGGRR